jgi:hypothetical protein
MDSESQPQLELEPEPEQVMDSESQPQLEPEPESEQAVEPELFAQMEPPEADRDEELALEPEQNVDKEPEIEQLNPPEGDADLSDISADTLPEVQPPEEIEILTPLQALWEKAIKAIHRCDFSEAIRHIEEGKGLCCPPQPDYELEMTRGYLLDSYYHMTKGESLVHTLHPH